MFRYIWRKELEKTPDEMIELRRRIYEERTVYVTDEATRNAMLKDLALVSTYLKASDVSAAKSSLENAKHMYAMARFNNKVLRYKSTMGGAIAVSYLLALGLVFAVGKYSLTLDFSQSLPRACLRAWSIKIWRIICAARLKKWARFCQSTSWQSISRRKTSLTRADVCSE